jgi:hypothetical protein
MWTEMNLGRNVFANVPGLVLVETDKGHTELMSLEAGDTSQQVLLTMDVWDADGSQVARLQRNALLLNDQERFAVTTSASSVRLSEKETGRIVVEAIVLDRNRVQVLQADLYSPLGDRLDIRPDRLIFRMKKFVHNHIEGRGENAAVVIGPKGFSLGAGL